MNHQRCSSWVWICPDWSDRLVVRHWVVKWQIVKTPVTWHRMALLSLCIECHCSFRVYLSFIFFSLFFLHKLESSAITSCALFAQKRRDTWQSGLILWGWGLKWRTKKRHTKAFFIYLHKDGERKILGGQRPWISTYYMWLLWVLLGHSGNERQFGCVYVIVSTQYTQVPANTCKYTQMAAGITTDVVY